MPIHDHQPSSRGRAFLWGGILLGAAFLAVVYTRGFGLLDRTNTAGTEAPLLTRQGDKIFVPEGSALRGRLAIGPASLEPVSPRLTLPAVVEADPARTAAVLTPLAGRLVKLDVRLGDRVTRGQVLAVLDSPDLAQAVDDDEKAGDTLRLADKNLQRQEAQNKLGVASDRDLDQARSDRAQAAAEYQRTQAHLAVLGVPGAQPGAGRRGPGRLLTVTAPVTGSVIALGVAPGMMVNDPTQPLMTIADLSSVWVTALVPEKDVAAVGPGQAAEVTLSAYPGRILRGTVAFASDVIESDSRRNKLRIVFANPDHALKPNMFASVVLAGPARSQVVVPSSALLMNNDRTTVFVATAPWTFERRTVDPQIDEGEAVAIRSGLQGGEQVVLRGGILLND